MTKKETGNIILRNQQEVLKATGKAFFIQPKIRSLIIYCQFTVSKLSTSIPLSANGFPSSD